MTAPSDPDQYPAWNLPCPNCAACWVTGPEQPNLPGQVPGYINGKFYQSLLFFGKIRVSNLGWALAQLAENCSWFDLFIESLPQIRVELEQNPQVIPAYPSWLDDAFANGDYYISGSEEDQTCGLKIFPRFCRLIPNELDTLILRWYLEAPLFVDERFPYQKLREHGLDGFQTADFSELKAAIADKNVPYEALTLAGKAESSLKGVIEQYVAQGRFSALVAALLYVRSQLGGKLPS